VRVIGGGQYPIFLTISSSTCTLLSKKDISDIDFGFEIKSDEARPQLSPD